jgi:hypothetical protein
MSHDPSHSVRPAGGVPDKPALDGIEDKWARQWEAARVVQV